MKRGWLLLLAASTACGVDTSTAAQPIVGGTPANQPAVVALLRRSVSCQPDTTPLECTGTLVAPRVVITAAHCVGDAPVNALEVFFGPDITGPGTRIAVSGGRAHPDYDPVTHANDVAALILARDAPVAPIPLASAVPDLTNMPVLLVGYGITAGSATDVGLARAGTARVMEVTAAELRMVPDPAMSCRGDSGGPVLSGGQIVGVTSYGDPACTQLGVAMRVDAYAALFQAILAEATANAPRAAFDPDAAFCDLPCATDADCPEETVCVRARCAYRGLPAAELGGACTRDGACACVALPDGQCRELVPCVTEGETTCRISDPGCGCGANGGGSLGLAALVLGAWLATGRRARHGNGRDGAKN